MLLEEKLHHTIFVRVRNWEWPNYLKISLVERVLWYLVRKDKAAAMTLITGFRVRKWMVLYYLWVPVLIQHSWRSCWQQYLMLQMQLPRNWSFHLENFRQREDKKRSAAWDEAGRKPGSFSPPTKNSIVLHSNVCKTDIFVEFSNEYFLTSPLPPPGLPPATAQSRQPPPRQLEPLWYSGQLGPSLKLYIYIYMHSYMYILKFCTWLHISSRWIYAYLFLCELL